MEAPDYSHNDSRSQFPSHNSRSSSTDDISGAGADHFIVEELLDFSNDDDAGAGDAPFFASNGNSTESSAVTVVESCNSSPFSSCQPNSFSDDSSRRSFADGPFSSDLCVPYDDLAELEWLSNFVEESFSSEDLQKLELISGVMVSAGKQNAAIFKPEKVPVPAKARSKRSRAGPSNWNNSRLLVLSPTTSSSELDAIAVRPSYSSKKPPTKKKNPQEARISTGDGRKCMHCATDKTPQWRTGPMGPKTLCNACGVRFKSGRLVPEYRPAASPTFVLTKHSNSHRKVLELRRQKELQRAPLMMLVDHRNMEVDESNGDDYLIHEQMGPDFRQLI